VPVVLAPVLIPFLTLVLCLLLWASSQAGETLFRSLFGAISDSIGRVWLVGKLITHGVDWLIHHTVKPIARHALTMQQPVAAFFFHLGAAIEAFAWSGWYTAVRTFEALYVLRHAVIPALLRPIIDLVHSLPHATRVVIREVHEAKVAAQRAISHAVAVTAPRALPWAEREAADAKATAERALRGIKGVRNLLGAAVLGGLIVKTLTRAGTGNIYCRNLRNVNKRVCGMDPSLLESLLLDTLLILGTISLVEYAKFLESITDEASGIVRGFIREA
jgi:hypothetical protein